MSIRFECDVCHSNAKSEDSRNLSLTKSVDGNDNAGLNLSIHICSQRCKNKLVNGIKNILTHPTAEDGGI